MELTRRHLALASSATLFACVTTARAQTRSTDAADPLSPLKKIRHLDYTVIFARDMPAMRRFYGTIMQFELYNELGADWIAYRVGASLLALTRRGAMFNDPETPQGALSLQMAFRVSPRDVDACAAALRGAGVAIVHSPTDQPWGHRTLFFRDPDGNVLEIYADI